jgi:hypothetical protein
MASIHPEPYLVFVFDDGEGGRYLRIQSRDGTVQMLPLTLERALKLIADLTAAARDMTARAKKVPQ